MRSQGLSSLHVCVVQEKAGGLSSTSSCIFDILATHISGTFVGESPDCLLLSGTVFDENLDHVCWATIQICQQNTVQCCGVVMECWSEYQKLKQEF